MNLSSSVRGGAVVLLCVAASGLTSGTSTGAPQNPASVRGPAAPSAEEFLSDKPAELVGLVRVRGIEARWTRLEDGDPIPFTIVEGELEQVLRGAPGWAEGQSGTVAKVDYSDNIFEAIAPPPMEGARYLLLAMRVPKAAMGAMPGVSWMALQVGFLRVRGEGRNQHVIWNGHSYSIDAIRTAVTRPEPMPLDLIVDPLRRLQVAELRLRTGKVGDERAFVRGLMMNVLEPEAQARRVERTPNPDPWADTFGFAGRAGSAHEIWFSSVMAMIDLARHDATRVPAVVAALEPVLVRTTREHVRLVVALALAEFGNAAGRDALVRGLSAARDASVSQDPDGTMSFPARFSFDGSTPETCAYALGKLGDRAGLRHADAGVRLAAASALADRIDDEVKTTLRALVKEQTAEVEKLRAAGTLTAARDRGDYRQRYPESWVRAQMLLARAGDDASLTALVDAHLADRATYPPQEHRLLPMSQATISSHAPSLFTAIAYAGSDGAAVTARLRRLFGTDARWDQPGFRELRSALETPAPAPAADEAEAEDDAHASGVPAPPSESELRTHLAGSDPRKRAEALAAAGFHRIAPLFDRVVDAALNGSGEEKSAAIYGLSHYHRDLPEDTLRRLLANAMGDRNHELGALELATRKAPARFAAEAVEILRAQLKAPPKAAGPESRHQFQMEQRKKFLARVLVRFAWGPLPQPLVAASADASPDVRRVIAVALGMSGNPAAVRVLEPLTRDADESVAQAARRAVSFLGPTEP